MRNIGKNWSQDTSWFRGFLSRQIFRARKGKPQRDEFARHSGSLFFERTASLVITCSRYALASGWASPPYVRAPMRAKANHSRGRIPARGRPPRSRTAPRSAGVKRPTPYAVLCAQCALELVLVWSACDSYTSTTTGRSPLEVIYKNKYLPLTELQEQKAYIIFCESKQVY